MPRARNTLARAKAYAAALLDVDVAGGKDTRLDFLQALASLSIAESLAKIDGHLAEICRGIVVKVEVVEPA